jgi:hypothetical protein
MSCLSNSERIGQRVDRRLGGTTLWPSSSSALLFEPTATRAALAGILSKLEARRVPVLLCGVRTQPSSGDEYKSAFAAMFSGLASEYNVLF